MLRSITQTAMPNQLATDHYWISYVWPLGALFIEPSYLLMIKINVLGLNKNQSIKQTSFSLSQINRVNAKCQTYTR